MVPLRVDRVEQVRADVESSFLSQSVRGYLGDDMDQWFRRLAIVDPRGAFRLADCRYGTLARIGVRIALRVGRILEGSY